MKSCNEISKITGLSVRTLHYYDEVGLLHPTAKSKSGYRLYDDTVLSKLKTIMLFRELGFSLREIKEITENHGEDVKGAVSRQIELLRLRREHLEKLIITAENILKGDAENMDFSAFDKKVMNEYKNEVIEKWGKTDAYREYEEKHADKKDNFDDGLMSIFGEIGEFKGESPKNEVVLSLIEKLQRYITDNYYTCTNEILKGLGEMYVTDERFRENIDSVGGKGTAEFTKKAINEYVK